MPNRVIRESVTTSPTLDQLSDFAERFFIRLTTVADDFGRFEAHPAILLAKTFPLRVSTMKVEKIATAYQELVTCCLVTTYDNNGKKYGFFNTWDNHQRRRAQHSKYPSPSSDNICQQALSSVAEESRNRGIETRGIRKRSIGIDILKYLNQKAGSSFPETKANLDLIEARYQEVPDQIRIYWMIDAKAKEWKGDPEKKLYLRPSTLFGKTKFSQYIGQVSGTKTSKPVQIRPGASIQVGKPEVPVEPPMTSGELEKNRKALSDAIGGISKSSTMPERGKA